MTDIDPALLAVLACPQSRDPLRHDSAADELVCTWIELRAGVPDPRRDSGAADRRGAAPTVRWVTCW